jgi:hypothetical protein
MQNYPNSNKLFKQMFARGGLLSLKSKKKKVKGKVVPVLN